MQSSQREIFRREKGAGREGTGAEGRPIRTVPRYILLQSPGWAMMALILMMVDRLTDLPRWSLWAAMAFWVAKDAVLFPLVWRAYDQNPSRIGYGLIGAQAVARERLAPTGYVRVHGELWQAEVVPDAPAVEEGETVTIRAVRGLTLVVKPGKAATAEPGDMVRSA